MSVGDFIRYAGSADLHDATIRRLERDGDVLHVELRTIDGRPLRLEFLGVAAVDEHDATGMILYALAELVTEAPLRRFAFVNWEDDDPARLGVLARSVHVLPTADDAPA